ncbi:uncharacterized protein LOC111518377 [Drosophila willistoni]|uniref:uncharacterized protein LOC111518377 n=1 Tax=Drosophila willistoni TaxID=7260 RepID=UPI000C26CAA9|nr:uncharacterized protein LOC111518377 [Drosophila willistoni]
MNLSVLWLNLLLVSLMLLFVLPSVEPTVLLWACLFRLQVCPFRTTTTTTTK